jgi:hypothetical protein
LATVAMEVGYIDKLDSCRGISASSTGTAVMRWRVLPSVAGYFYMRARTEAAADEEFLNHVECKEIYGFSVSVELDAVRTCVIARVCEASRRLFRRESVRREVRRCRLNHRAGTICSQRALVDYV